MEAAVAVAHEHPHPPLPTPAIRRVYPVDQVRDAIARDIMHGHGVVEQGIGGGGAAMVRKLPSPLPRLRAGVFAGARPPRPGRGCHRRSGRPP